MSESTSRRALHWEKVRGSRAILALFSSTALGAGLFPVAPGTMGTLVGMAVAYLTAAWHWGPRAVLWTAIFALGVWAAKTFDEIMETEDNQNIVIDEVLGYGIAAWTAGTNTTALIAAFILFRFFDIVKPYPVRNVDRWSRNRATRQSAYGAWWGGAGVMLDDLLAGFQGLAVMLILQAFGILPW